MLIPRCLVRMFPVGMMIFAAGVASGQNYPDKPIRMLTPPAGGSTKFPSRLLADAAAGSLGQRMVVEGRPGAIGVELGAQAPPDGYTVLHYNNLVWLMPLFRKVAWDSVTPHHLTPSRFHALPPDQ